MQVSAITAVTVAVGVLTGITRPDTLRTAHADALGRQLCRHLAQRQAAPSQITDDPFQLGSECPEGELLDSFNDPPPTATATG